jgi:tripeptide aminopeptidase
MGRGLGPAPDLRRTGKRVQFPVMLPRSKSSVANVYRSLAAARARLAARDGQIVRTQIDVAQIAAPTGEEGERANWVASRLRDCGLANVRVDAAGNVVARRMGTRREVEPVVVCAHLDTVFPRETRLEVRNEGNRLVGPGINDNGRGLAVMLALAAELAADDTATERPIDFVATTGEEGLGDLRGAKHYFAAEGREAAAMVALDGAGDERIVHRALGSRRFRVEFAGPGGHSWASWGMPNAVHAASFCAATLARLVLPREPRTTLTVGRIGGGLSVNAIPASSWIEVDVRSTSSQHLDRCERELYDAARAATDEENGRRAAGTPPLSHLITRIGARPCGETPADHPLVQSALQATRLVGRWPDLVTASTDANVPISRGIPAIAIGAGGRGGDAHTTHEWYENTDGSVGVARALTILVAAAGMRE